MSTRSRAVYGGPWVACGCGHDWLEHHGVDPDDGCMGIPYGMPQCPCRLTATQVHPAG